MDGVTRLTDSFGIRFSVSWTLTATNIINETAAAVLVQADNEWSNGRIKIVK